MRLIGGIQLPYLTDISSVPLFQIMAPAVPPGDFVWHIVMVPAGANVDNPANWLAEDEAVFNVECQ